MHSLFLFLFVVSLGTPQLKHRTEPKVLEASCRDRVSSAHRRLANLVLLEIEDQDRSKRNESNFSQKQVTAIYNTMNGIRVSPSTCTRSYLSGLDLYVSLQELDYVMHRAQ